MEARLVAKQCRAKFSRELASETAPERWYAAQTIRGREHFAKSNLERQGVRTYLPLFSRPVARRGTTVGQISAFFPGYVFIAMPAVSSLWRSVRGTYGVSRVISFGDAPAPTPVGFVELLLARTAPDGVLGFADDIRPGDPIRVVGGAFDRVYGVLCSVEPSQRVVVLLNLMGRQVPVSLDRRSVMACAK